MAIAMFDKIKPDELWVGLGTGSPFWYIPVHMDAMNAIWMFIWMFIWMLSIIASIIWML